MSLDGISRLIVVTQMKAGNANDDAVKPTTTPPPPPPKPLIADGAVVGGLFSKSSIAATAFKTAAYGDGEVVRHSSAKTPGFLRSAFSRASDGATSNFAIQNLMSNYNEAEQLASSVQKKQDESRSGWIGKI